MSRVLAGRFYYSGPWFGGSVTRLHFLESLYPGGGGGGGGGHMGILGGAYVRYQNLKNTPKALISGQKKHPYFNKTLIFFH